MRMAMRSGTFSKTATDDYDPGLSHKCNRLSLRFILESVDWLMPTMVAKLICGFFLRSVVFLRNCCKLL